MVYYGKLLITEAENEIFGQLIERYPNHLMEVALFAFLQEESSQTLIYAIRQNRTEELLKIIDASMEEVRLDEDFCAIEKEFISMLVESYNHPEPDVPMEQEEIDKQLRNMGVDPEKVIYMGQTKL